MSGCFSFRFQEASQRHDSLVLFFSGQISKDVLIKRTKFDVEQNLLPDKVVIIVPAAQYDQAASMLGEPSVYSEMDSLVGAPTERVQLFGFDGEGNLNSSSFCHKNTDHFTVRLLKAGMLDIFQRRRGLIVASSNFHFLKPSGDHCDGFIRASNLLVNGDEVALLALAILPYLANEVKTIYVDTSSISYLLSAAVLMSQRFHDRPPLIQSFESYAAFNQEFDFVEDQSSLVFISATTSGSLASKLLKQTGFECEQVITLFYSFIPNGQLGVFDISEGKDFKVKSYKKDNCWLCDQDSQIIRIVGDQFLPETPANEQLLIRKVDFTKARELFFSEFATKKYLKWSVLSVADTGSEEHFFIDVERLVKNPPDSFLSALDGKLNRFFSRHVQSVIHLSDSGSVALADLIKNRINDADSIRWLSLDAMQATDVPDQYSVVVIAGAITSGRKLLDASRKLRVLQRDCSITYVVGFSKLPTDSDLKQLERDLEMGGHKLIVLRACPMPRITSHAKTSWNVEVSEYLKWDSDNPFSKGTLPPILNTRHQSIKDRKLDDNGLFLPTVTGVPLKLRKSFAFWSSIELNTDDATQADVYWTIQAILHDLRARVEGGLGNAYHTTVLSPTCFDRYNDGVIQAALLRSATSLELNYSIDESYSQKMYDVIASILSNLNTDQGEAGLEFLLALWCGKLKLTESDVKRVVETFRTDQQMSEDAKFMLARIGELYGT